MSSTRIHAVEGPGFVGLGGFPGLLEFLGFTVFIWGLLGLRDFGPELLQHA